MKKLNQKKTKKTKTKNKINKNSAGMLSCHGGWLPEVVKQILSVSSNSQ